MRRYSESPSSFSCYITCPKRYEFKYVHKLPDPSGPAAELGSKFHEAAYASWHTMDPSHEDPKIQKMLEALYGSPDVQRLPHDKLIPGKTCEYQMKVPCGKQTLFGYVDGILETIGCALDFKTSGRPWDEKKVHENFQHITYPYGLRKLGISPVNVFYYIVVTTSKNPICQVISLKIGDAVLEKFEREFNNVVDRIDMDIFPATPGKSCNWCPYKGVCPAWSKTKENNTIPIDVS